MQFDCISFCYYSFGLNWQNQKNKTIWHSKHFQSIFFQFCKTKTKNSNLKIDTTIKQNLL